MRHTRALLVALALLLVSPSPGLPQQPDKDTILGASGSIDVTQLSSCALRALAANTSMSVASPLATLITNTIAVRRQAGCNGNTCPEPKSCGSWSSWYNCDGTFCGEDSLCQAKGTNATLQTQERFRACTLSGGGNCIEYEHQSIRLHCGCTGGDATTTPGK